MKDKELLSRVLVECKSRLDKNPNFRPLAIVNEEVEYLRALIDGETQDRSNLENIQIGLLAVREFETDDPEFADLIFQVMELVEKLK
ncbi:MAG TPA: immunity protein Tsi6 family protein [Gammaproteobacteria bacterium]